MGFDRYRPSPGFFKRAAAFVFFFGLGLGLLSTGGGRGILSMSDRARTRGRLESFVTARTAYRSREARPPTAMPRPAEVAGDAGRRAGAIRSFATRPMIFEANQGQTASQVKFLSRGSGYALFLTGDEAALRLQKSEVRSQKLEGKTKRRTTDGVLHMKLLGANSSARVTGVDELPGRSNYFIGNDPAQWRTNVPNYARVKYEGVYPGVDLVYYGNQQQLEYDFVVAPGADPGAIVLDVGAGLALPSNGRNGGLVPNKSKHAPEPTKRAGQAPPLRIAANGDLIVEAGGGEVIFHKPIVYQTDLPLTASSAGSSLVTRHSPLVEGRYILEADGTVRFDVPNYDKSKTLTIDPVLAYSTYLGGKLDDNGSAIAVDAAGNAYVAGHTLSTDFPTTARSFQPVCGGCSSGNTNAFVTKFNPSGSALVYSTFLGGLSNDSASAIAVDSAGSAYVTGSALSINFPKTPGAFQTTCSSCPTTPDAFVTKLSVDGSTLVYSTYLGGSNSDSAAGIAVDANGSAYVTGTTFSANFPLSATPLQGTCNGCPTDSDAFVTKFNPTGTLLIYSTFLGGSLNDAGLAIAVDSSFGAYVAGKTGSNDFPISNYFQFSLAGTQDGFVTKFDSAGGLSYSTYVGGAGSSECRGIAVDSTGNAYVTGNTTSSTGFPLMNALISNLPGSQGAFVLKINNNGSSLAYSTYLGGSNGSNGGNGIAVDALGNAYVTGQTSSTSFPVVNGIQHNGFGGTQDAFVTKINGAGTAFIFSDYLGGSSTDVGQGIAVDSSGNAYVTGQTFSGNFPTANPFQPRTGGGFDAFVTEFTGLAAPTVTLSPGSLTFGNQAVGTTSSPMSVTLTNNGDANLTITRIVAAPTGVFAETDTCIGSVAPGASCSINVTFTPTFSGTQFGAIGITDNASNSPQVINLNGTGTAPAITLSVNTLNFGNQGVGTPSPELPITLANTGNAPLNITSFVASAGFSLTNNTCTGSVAPGANCTLSVIFTPNSVTTFNGTLSFTDNAPGSPQTVRLTGTGVVAFAVSATPSPQTVNKGTATATFAISVTSQYGFKDPVSLTCQITVAICSFNPNAIMPGQNSVLTVSNLTAVGGDTLNFSITGTSGTQTSGQALTVLFPNFGLIAAPPTTTVTAGQSAAYTLSLVPINNFNQTVNFTCVSQVPAATCVINPASITPTGTTTETVGVTITTTALPLAGPRYGPRLTAPPLGALRPGGWFIWLFAFALLTTLAAAKRRRARLGFAMTTLLVLLWAACSVGSNNPSGTAAGSYVSTITAATTAAVGATPLQHTATIGLIVK